MEENKELVEIKQKNNKIVGIANEITVNNQETLISATEFTKEIKNATKNVVEYWKPLKDNASKIHKELCAKEKENLKPLQDAEIIIKNKISLYMAEQEKIQKQKELELKKRQEEEAYKQMQEAEKLRAEGNILEAEIAETIAESIDNIQTTVAPTVDKVDGLSFKTSYKIKIVDDNKVPVSLNGLILRPVDTSVISKLVQASKGSIKIDGVEIETVKTPIIRS